MWKVENGQLPKRLAQTLEGVARGQTDKEIAREMGISPGTVRRYVDTLFFKLRLSTGKRALLVAQAIHKGVLTSTAMLLLLIIGVNTLADADQDMRRSSTRLTTRTVRSSKTGRNARRGKKNSIWGDPCEVELEELAA